MLAAEEIQRRQEGAFDPEVPSNVPFGDEPCAPEEVQYRVVQSGSTGVGCLDEFDRTVSVGSWGTGNMGTWQLSGINPKFETNMSVDGDKGLYTLVDTDQDAGFAWLDGLISTPPIEILCKMAVEFTDVGVANTIEFAVQIDGPPDPTASFDWVYCFLDRIDATGTTDNWTYSLEFSLQNSEGGFSDALGLFSQGPFLDADNVRWDLWFRVRIEANGDTKARVWEDGGSEPGTWTMENLDGLMAAFTFATTGVFLSPESDGVEYTIFELDNFEITEGCSGGPTYAIINDQSDVVGNIDEVGLITSSDLNLECPLSLVTTLSGSGTGDLPTDAQYVTDVWFDYLHATRDTHWYFETPRTINVLSPIMAGTQVRVAFVSGA